jgi:hypothetical protein
LGCTGLLTILEVGSVVRGLSVSGGSINRVAWNRSVNLAALTTRAGDPEVRALEVETKLNPMRNAMMTNKTSILPPTPESIIIL